MPETPHGLYQVTLTETASLQFHQRGNGDSSMFSLYPLVNIYITKWKITMLFKGKSTLNQLFRLGHVQVRKLLVITRGYRDLAMAGW